MERVGLYIPVRGTVATTRRRTINGGGRRSRGKANLAVVLVLVAAWHGRSPSVGGRARRVSAIIPASLQHRATSAWTPLEVAPTTSSRGSELPPMIPTPPSHSTVDLNSVKVNQNAKCLSIRVQIQSRLMTAKIILQNRRHKDTQTRRTDCSMWSKAASTFNRPVAWSWLPSSTRNTELSPNSFRRELVIQLLSGSSA